MLSSIIYFQKNEELGLKEIAERLNLKGVSNVDYYINGRGNKSISFILQHNLKKLLMNFNGNESNEDIRNKLDKELPSIYEGLFRKYAGGGYEK